MTLNALGPVILAVDPISAGDTAWVLISAGLVMLMVPGLALFYGGMVRHKNVLATLMQCMMILAVVSLQFALFGYSLAFGGDVGGVIGDFSHVLLAGIGADADPTYAATIPAIAFVVFQCMFAAITPALIIGAFAERISFKAVVVFSLLWSTLVYDPVAHWVWGVGGWLREMGALDFAGGTVVHVTAGVAALACVLYMGKRKGFGTEEMRPNNIPLTILGAGLLWFGWFGFNAGSALSAGGLAAMAFAATHLGAAAAAASWTAVEWFHKGKPTVMGAAAGMIAGLVAITPASGFVMPGAAILIGLASGVVCYLAVAIMKNVLRLDDSLDAFGVHGIGGVTGALLTGVFATVAIGVWEQVYIQLVAVLAVAAYAFVATWGILWATDKMVGLRVTDEAEERGLDVSEHGEIAYHYHDAPKTPHVHAKDASLVLGVMENVK